MEQSELRREVNNKPNSFPEMFLKNICGLLIPFMFMLKLASYSEAANTERPSEDTSH